MDFSRWMEKLPAAKRTTVSLVDLKLPGSHDSFTCTLDESSDITCDQPDWLRRLARESCLAKKIVYNWSLTQRLTFIEQLTAGVRYFDLRVAVEPQTKDIRVVHGFYGGLVAELLVDLIEFLTERAGEVVLLDFNHFYDFAAGDHTRLGDLLGDLLSEKLVPFDAALNELTLDRLCTRGQQVLVFYQAECVSSAAVGPRHFWPSTTITSPWADTDKEKTLFTFLDKCLADRRSCPRPPFFVMQAVLTPTATDVLTHCCSSLEAVFAKRTTATLVGWLAALSDELRMSLNIVLADFVEGADFCERVVRMNF